MRRRKRDLSRTPSRRASGAAGGGYTVAVAHSPQDPPPPLAIEYPLVPHTPAGVDELEAWRERQLGYAGISWAIPLGGFALALLFDALGWPALTGPVILVTTLSAAAAPGLTVVFLLRRRKARLLAEEMPQLPRARLRLASQVSRDEPVPHGRGGRRST